MASFGGAHRPEPSASAPPSRPSAEDRACVSESPGAVACGGPWPVGRGPWPVVRSVVLIWAQGYLYRDICAPDAGRTTAPLDARGLGHADDERRRLPAARRMVLCAAVSDALARRTAAAVAIVPVPCAAELGVRLRVAATCATDRESALEGVLHPQP